VTRIGEIQCQHCNGVGTYISSSPSHDMFKCPRGHVTSSPRARPEVPPIFGRARSSQGVRVPHDPPAFDLPTEQAAGRAGAEQAHDREGDEPDRWRALADDAVERVCRENELLIVDLVWEIVDAEFDAPTPLDGRAMSGIMVRASKRGLMEVHYVPGMFNGVETLYKVSKASAREGCHANEVTVWRSKVWRGLTPTPLVI